MLAVAIFFRFEHQAVSQSCLRLRRKTHGIGATGAVDDFRVSDNLIAGVQGGQALFTRPDTWNRPRNIRFSGNRLAWCSTQDTALIQALGDDIEIAHNRAIGGHYPSLLSTDGKAQAASDNL